MKIPPTRSIRRRERKDNRRFRRKIRMKNAQGLKLSSAPRVMVRTGRDKAEVLTRPMNGI